MNCCLCPAVAMRKVGKRGYCNNHRFEADAAMKVLSAMENSTKRMGVCRQCSEKLGRNAKVCSNCGTGTGLEFRPGRKR